MCKNGNIWPKMTKNAYFGPNLAVFGPKILIFMGVSKSFGTNITENHLDNLFASFFGQALDQMGQKCRYLAQNALNSTLGPRVELSSACLSNLFRSHHNENFTLWPNFSIQTCTKLSSTHFSASTSTSFELAPSQARATSIKSTWQEWRSQSVSDKGSQWSDSGPIKTVNCTINSRRFKEEVDNSNVLFKRIVHRISLNS